MIGGFVRDAVQGSDGSDIDVAFVTDEQGLRTIEACAKKKGWLHTVDYTKGYIHFGSKTDKRDVEGKIVVEDSVQRKFDPQ